MSGDQVLVIGGSGFIGAHCIVKLLQAGYRVRTTVRARNREADVRAMVMAGGVESAGALSFAAADLVSDEGWAEAVAGCRYVFHVASPFPLNAPKHEDELIVPAREGTLRVLRAARDAGVQRVVMTSSSAAVIYGHKPQPAPFDETSWTNIADRKGVTTYAKSKTLAEQAAWAFIKEEGGNLELSSVNPVGVFGPVLGADYSSSIVLVQRMLDGKIPGLPRMAFGVVDVRDVADLHLLAATGTAARNERFLAVAGDFIPALDVAKFLKARLGVAAGRVTTRQMPDWFVRFYARFDADAALILPELGRTRNATSNKAMRLLGWTPRSAEDAVVSTAESLIRLGLLKR